MEDLTCEEAWQLLKDNYDQAVNDSVPLQKDKKKFKPQWLKSSVKKSIKKKYALYQKYRRTENCRDYVEYKKQNNKTRKLVRKAQAEFEHKLLKQFKQKPKAFYSYIRNKQKVRVGVSQLEKPNGDLTDTDQDAA